MPCLPIDEDSQLSLPVSRRLTNSAHSLSLPKLPHLTFPSFLSAKVKPSLDTRFRLTPRSTLHAPASRLARCHSPLSAPACVAHLPASAVSNLLIPDQSPAALPWSVPAGAPCSPIATGVDLPALARTPTPPLQHLAPSRPPQTRQHSTQRTIQTTFFLTACPLRHGRSPFTTATLARTSCCNPLYHSPPSRSNHPLEPHRSPSTTRRLPSPVLHLSKRGNGLLKGMRKPLAHDLSHRHLPDFARTLSLSHVDVISDLFSPWLCRISRLPRGH